MEFELSSFFLVLSFLILIFIILQKLRTTRNPNSNNFPPSPRKLPLIGHLHLLSASSPPHHTLRDLAKKYGPLMHLKLGEIDHIIVSSPEAARHFLKTHDLIFASRPSLLATEIGCYGNTDIAFSPYGDYWRQVRKICTLELLTNTRVQSFRHIREEEAMDLSKWIARNEGSPINLTEKVNMMSYDITVRASLGKKTDEQATFIKVLKEGMQNLSVFHISDLFPTLKFLDVVSGLKRKIKKHHDHLDRIFGKIIEERKRADTANIDRKREKHFDHEDLLDVLLRIQGGGALELPLTTDNIKAILLDMFAAGVDTSATVIDWAMVELLKNPTIMKKAQDEARQLFDSKAQIVDETHLDQLTYLKCIIKETLRLHLTAPLLLPRESRDHCVINGYDISAKTRVLVNVWAIGRDPAYWDEPEMFKPERFLEKTVDFTASSSMEYIPFGSGRRSCPGMTFGLANVELPLAMFMYHFDWVLPRGMEELDVAEQSGDAVVRRKSDLVVIPLVVRPLV